MKKSFIFLAYLLAASGSLLAKCPDANEVSELLAQQEAVQAGDIISISSEEWKIYHFSAPDPNIRPYLLMARPFARRPGENFPPANACQYTVYFDQVIIGARSGWLRIIPYEYIGN